MGVLIRLVAWVSFLAAGVLTALRLIQPDDPFAQQAIGFMPWTIPLFAIALLLFLFHVFFPGKSRWQITMALAGLALAGLLVQGWWLSPLFLGDKPEAGPQAEAFEVLTLNLDTGAADPNDVVSTAVTSGTDILVLQEVAPNTLARMEQAGLDTAFPHRVGQPMVGGQFGTMVFSSSTLSDVTFMGSVQSSVLFRVALPQGSTWMMAVGVPTPDSSTPEAWLADLGQLVETSAALHPTIVAGDFEAGFDHGPFRELLDTGLRDVGERANAGWQRTWPVDRSYYGIPLPRLTQPDHVLIGSTLSALSQTTLTVPGTDHRGVLAELAFR